LNSSGLNALKSNNNNNNPMSNSLISQNPLLNNTNQFTPHHFNITSQSAFNVHSPNYNNPLDFKSSNPVDNDMKEIVILMNKHSQRKGYDLEQVLKNDFRDKQTINKDSLKQYLSSIFLLDDKKIKTILDSLNIDHMNNIKAENFLSLIHKYHVPDVKNIFEDNILNDPLYHNVRYGEDSLLGIEVSYLGDKQDSWFTKLGQLLQNKHINLLSRLNAYDMDNDGKNSNNVRLY
jgi:hypothetical protein